ncbi:STAS domain-containing protein [Streptacidiphilus sp. 4-A2]|nr:STAS domain-containing protein [Streptacidiphilus sp. 4-A2]
MKTALILTGGHTASGPVLTVAGDLEHGSAERFRTAVNAIPLHPGQLLTVDLSGLGFCDSSGITALIAAHGRTQAHGADMTLSHVPPTTVRILRILGLDQVFRIHPAPGASPDPA